MNLRKRPRRNRVSPAVRNLVRETVLTPHDFVLPMFLCEGQNQKIAIKSMPGVFRLSADLLIKEAKAAYELGIQAIALFPVVDEKLKDKHAKESKNKNGLLHKTIKELKNKIPDLCVITDIAMDPYSSDGHDGLVENGRVINDASVEILAEQALSHAEVGADIVAPSDMMDGRIGAIRKTLDQSGFNEVGILAYTAKYASSYYGPFREALDSAPKFGDKKTYQMDPANSKEAFRELQLDLEEGADIVMVKPAMMYLDIIAKIKAKSTVPVAAYQVSGEYAMIMAAGNNGWLDSEKAMMEALLSIKRAGSDIIFSYYAKDAAKKLIS